MAKDKNRSRAVIMVGHMTKANEMAGLRTLGAFGRWGLIFRRGSDEELRTLMATKNRFGRTGEIGFFPWKRKG